MVYNQAIHNGKLIPITGAHLPVTSVEFAYGFGVYENIRAVRGTALHKDRHITRLLHSAELIGLKHGLTSERVAADIALLFSALPQDAAVNLKLLLIGGATAADAQLFILPLAPKFLDRKLYKTGVMVITKTYERLIPQAKTLNMLGSYLAYRTARQADAYDCLLLNRAGYILEGTRTNFFAIKDRTLYTQPDDLILPGVTRALVLETAAKNNFSVEQRLLRPADLANYDGAFLTSTSAKIVPINQIDDRKLIIPPTIQELQRAFGEI